MKATIQFPLPLLAYAKTYQERISIILDVACITTGMHRMKKLSSGELETELAAAKILPRSGGLTAEQVQALALGDKFCGVIHRHAKGAFEIFRAVECFLDHWKSKGLSIPWTRVPADLAWEAMKGNAATYQRFTALCAVNSIIGSKRYAIVTKPRIRAGMLGYASGKLLFDDAGQLTDAGRALIAERSDPKPTIATDDQVRTLLTNLVKSSLLSRFTPYRGSLTYYSKTLTDLEIAEAILKRVERNATNPRLIELGNRIRNTKQGTPLLSGDSLLSGGQNGNAPHNRIAPHNSEVPTQSLPVPHPVPTCAPHNASSYASLNAALNASLNALSRASEIEESESQLPEAESRKPVVGIESLPATAVLTPPVAPEVPSLETAIAFARTFPKRPNVEQIVEAWLDQFATKPTADWRKSLSKKLLGGKRSR